MSGPRTVQHVLLTKELLGTWTKVVEAFITNEYARAKFWPHSQYVTMTDEERAELVLILSAPVVRQIMNRRMRNLIAGIEQRERELRHRETLEQMYTPADREELDYTPRKSGKLKDDRRYRLDQVSRRTRRRNANKL